MTAPKIDGGKGDNKLYFTDDETAEVTLNELANPTGFATEAYVDNEIDELSTVTTTITSSATPTPARASIRTVLKITAQSEAFELQNPTGTPQEDDLLKVEVTDDGTPRAITYGSDYADGTAKRATTTTASTRLMMIFQYSGSVWTCEHSAEDV